MNVPKSFECYLEVLDVLLNEVLLGGDDDRAAECVQVSVVQLVLLTGHRIRRTELDAPEKKTTNLGTGPPVIIFSLFKCWHIALQSTY